MVWCLMTASGGVSREQYLDNLSDGILDKTRKIHIDYICDFIFDDERLENIYPIDKRISCA